MMYSFILLSLVVAVYCHQPVPELYDADKYEAKVKRLDEVEELIDRVTTRIQNLKDKRELRQKQKDDADRRSKSILLRLDRMKLNDGSFHCDKPDKEFKCRKNTQCVNNILVCDNVPDCEDKSDEDPDLCKLPFEEGSTWHGHNVMWTCLPQNIATVTSYTESAFITFRNADNDPAIKLRNKVIVVYGWEDGHSSEILVSKGFYKFGSQSISFPAESFDGTLVTSRLTFDLVEGIVHSYDYLTETNKLCGKDVYYQPQ